MMITKNKINALGYFLLISLYALISPQIARALEIDVAYVGNTGDAAFLGVKQGLDEANLQGQFLGQTFTVDTIAPEQALVSELTRYLAVVTAVNHDLFLKLSDSLPDVPIFNLTLTDDDLRSACMNNALHIIPSKKMKSDAETQWLIKSPDSNASAHAWHADFNKFAARDLNKRFLKNQMKKMDDSAWAGWAAIKIISDTVAREKITDAGKLLDYLKSSLTFDGQKGANLNFRSTGQLRQLLLLVENDKIVAEAPVRGVAKPPKLDSLGILECEK
jgi:hypothetical protein